MYCKKCGKRLADGDKFCGNCGTKIDASEINIGFAEEESKPKKNFDFGAFNWDLDGYPDEDKAKTEDVDFNWNTVLEEKKRKAIEEKSFTETIMTENELFDRIQSEDNAKDASELSFNWELGSTTRVEKADRFESIIPKVEEKAELDIPVEVSEDHEEIKDLVDVDEALAAGIAAASSPRKSIDKFYTFNQKNEEFQALLDQEYERLRNRIREDSEAEAIIANKEEKLEQARATWSKEPVEEAEETVEVTEETEAPVEVAVESEVEATEVEEAKAEAVNDAENTEEAQDTEVETEEAPETEEADLGTESEFEEVGETKEATEEDEEAVQEAEEPAIQEEACACETEEEVACDISSEDVEEACVVETQAQAEEVEKAEETEAEETSSEPESGNPPSDEEEKEEEPLGDEDSKETKLHYSDIFANDDVHDSDSRDEQKTGRWKIIALDIIIVILAIAVICSGILVFAKGSAPANKISQGISWVTEKFSGSNDSSKDKATNKSDNEGKQTKSMEDVVAAAKKNYVNIGKVQYDSKLKFDTSKDYGISELKSAKKLKDGEFSNGKLLSEAIVNLSLGYYSGLTDKVNSGSDDVLKLINEDSELYGHVKAIAEGDEEQQIKNIKIGEIKNSDSNYYVILQITEGKANSSQTSTEKKILSILNKGKELKVTAATDAQ